MDKDNNIYGLIGGPPEYLNLASFTSTGKRRWRIGSQNVHFLRGAFSPPIIFENALFFTGGAGLGLHHGFLDLQGKAIKRFNGYDEFFHFPTNGINFIENSGRFVTILREPRLRYKPDDFKNNAPQRILVLLIEAGYDKPVGYWPMASHNSRASASVD